MPVTVVVAGAGFGKTTALSQAIRANDAAPRGIDAWVACEPGDEDADRLSRAMLDALGAPSRDGGGIDRVLGALGATVPLDVCIFIDDLHELPTKSAGERFVCDLAARLPPHAHLVLASRDPVPIPLARRRAAEQVVDIGDDALAFTDSEVTALAALLGQDQTACEGLAGWPSLVRLVLSAPAGAMREFLWEEIVARLSPAERSGLLALAMLGSGSASEIRLVAGHDVGIDHLLRSVPLLHQDTSGRIGAHHLWEDAAARIFPTSDILDVRRRALSVLLERGETVRMGSAAVRWGDPAMFRIACISLVRETLGALPIDTATRWLAGTPSEVVGTAEHRLLDVAVRQAQHRKPDDIDGELDALEVIFDESGDVEGHAVTLGLGATAAHARGDNTRLVTLTQRIKALPGVSQQPVLQFFVSAVDAALASLAGDIGGTLKTIETMSFDQVPPLVRELMTRLHVTMLILAGRAHEAIPIGLPLLQSPNAFVKSIPPSMLRWSVGDPSACLTAPPSMAPFRDLNARDRVVAAAHCAVVAASFGDRALADTALPVIEATKGNSVDGRHSAITATALACFKILDHDEPAAKTAIADHLARHPLADPRSEMHLRRVLATVYIANDSARTHWDTAELGPTLLRARAVARQFLAARDGQIDRDADLGPPGIVVTSLPLAWSVELAVRAHAVGCPDGGSLFRTLVAWLPAPTRREVEWLATHGDASCQASAAGLFDNSPDLLQTPLSIGVLGLLQLREGTTETDRSELRRGRVRTLLALLVLKGAMRRERICDLMWPDLEPAAAAQNLRVTLTHLRRLLEPDRPAGRSSWRIRGDANSIQLAGHPLVDTDLRQAQSLLAEAEQAQQRNDLTEVIVRLTRVVDLWRGDPLIDLSPIDELNGEVEHIHRSLVDACLRLGELQLVAGRFDEALRCAERGRIASPYSERAHRLAIACHLQGSDRSGLEAAVRSTQVLLGDLGVEPEDPTKMLLRRAAKRIGATAV